MHIFSSPKVIISSLVLIVIITTMLQLNYQESITADIRSKASENSNTITVCSEGTSGCAFSGIAGIQQAIEAAQDGGTISIQSGKYQSMIPIVTSPQNCLIHTRGKSLTILGNGAMLDNNNGGLNDETKRTRGICVHGGGKVRIDSLTVRQTMFPAVDISNSEAILTNLTFIDIDHAIIWVTNSRVGLFNSQLLGSAGPGIQLNGNSYGKIENNTFFGNSGAGIDFYLCTNNNPKGDAKNNLIVNPSDLFSRPVSGSGIGAECKAENLQKLAGITTANNFTWKAKERCSGDNDVPSEFYGPCVAGEICEGSTFVHPMFIGANDDHTVCVHGEGTLQGDFHTRPESPVSKAGAGFGYGPCASSQSAGCQNYIAGIVFPVSPTAPPSPDNNPGNGGGGGGGGGGHIPPTVTGIYPEPSFAWPTTVDDNGQSPTTPPGGSGNNNPTTPPNTGGGGGGTYNPNGGNRNTGGGGNNPPITYYFPPTGSPNNQDGGNNSNSGNNNTGNSPDSGQNKENSPSVKPRPKPTSKPLIDVIKTIKNTKTAINNFVEILTRLSKLIMP